VPKLGEAMAVIRAIGVADCLRQVLTGLGRCEDKLGRKRMEELLKKAGSNDEYIANLLRQVGKMRQETGGAKK